MQCLQCQHENAVDAKFCNQCAASFAPVCSACGYENAATAKFCNQCGTLLIASTSARGSTQIMQQEVESESRFQALIRAVMGMLQRERRVTYRSLKHVFRLDDGLLEEVKEELCLTGKAWDEGGKVLVWTGEIPPAAPPAVETLMQPPSVEARAVSSAATSTPSPPVTDTDVRPNERTASPEESSTDRQPAGPIAVTEPVRSVLDAERRQLTVMFCDLVGSTDLASTLDPEDLREVVRAYQETAAAIIQRYEGHIAQYLGDGLLVYFGFPVAHEDDASRAVHTGLSIVNDMATLNTRLSADYGVQLAVRIGIHTGPVVVGEMGGGGRHENLALGETPNIAARLEGLAQPNTIVVTPVTAQLVQRSFVLEGVGSHALKGVAEPMMLLRVIGPREGEQDYETMASGGFVALVGRDEEIGLLLRRWEQSKEGRGQVIVMSGEAGIGKSSLVDSLRHHVRQEGMRRITFRCSPYHTNSALYPIIEHLRRVLNIQPDDTAETQLMKVE